MFDNSHRGRSAATQAAPAPTGITAQLQATRQRLATAIVAAGRPADDVMLLAVSKTRSAAEIREAHAAGQRAFGENYLQDARSKQPCLEGLGITWHFIGALQSNKTREVATHFDWVHTVDRLKVAKRLSTYRAADAPALQICLQINISREAQKAGVMPEDAAEIVREILQLPRLQLRGLMAIPAYSDDPEQRRAPLAALRELRDSLRIQFPEASWDTLSMGMSGDMDEAVAEGATIVRIGTAIFGARHYGKVQ